VAGAETLLRVEKDPYAPFGCNFRTYLADQKHSCANHCMFCFIDQLPPGLRESLYFKDDDERLSFLFGNYITMTNMDAHELDRLLKMHISPVNVSVHTTNPELRVRMLANRRGGEILGHLQKLAAAGIALNCQLVLCRGVNDGAELRRTLGDLLALGPSVESIAAVPFGMTRYRKGLYPLTPYDAASAAETIDILEEFGEKSLAATGRRVVYPSDEWYLCAGRPIPPAAFYEDYAQLENGVGMWRLFREEFLAELDRPRRMFGHKSVDLVTGTLAAPLLRELAAELHRQYPMVTVTVHAIRNDFFGGNVSVAGLVTGTDIAAQCRGALAGEILGVPEVMLRAEKDLFLDGTTPADLERELGTKVELLPSGGGACARALLRTGLHLSRRPAAQEPEK
jgi:putative radical SAM enzyme (TIGR03279 family)